MYIKYTGKRGLAAHLCHPTLSESLRQKNYKVKTSLGHLAKCHLKIKSKN